MKTFITWRLPIKIANEANSSEHWTKKARRHRIQKNEIKVQFLKEKPNITLPCTIVLTRIAPRELDKADNLPMSFKRVIDAIAEELTGNHIPGRADSDKRLNWQFKQAKGGVREYGILIEFIFES